jgi:hypothetical protein
MLNKLNLYGPLNQLGYGIFTRGIIKGLAENNVLNFSVLPIGQVHIEDQREAQLLKSLIETMTWERKAPSVAIWHEFDLTKFSSDKLIAYPIFETTKFNKSAISQLSQMDAVIVASKWAKSVVTDNIGDNVPVFVVPGASDLNDENLEEDYNKNNIFTFINVGKFEKRKAHADLLQAYKQAFSNSPNETRLILHCFNPHMQNYDNNIKGLLSSLGYTVHENSTNMGAIIASAGNALVSIPRGFIPKSQLISLYKYSHVGIYPSRGEGWNLPLVESIQSGLPCIATNYSAHTEYLNAEFNYPQELLLNNFKMETALDNMYFHGDRGYWASPSIEEMAEKMLYAEKNYAKIMETFGNTSDLIKAKFTWKNSASSLLEVLDILA